MNFRRNQVLEVTALGTFTGALVRYKRKRARSELITVALIQPAGKMDAGFEFTVHHSEVKPGKAPFKMQGSRLLPISCFCTGERYVLRATGYALVNFGNPICPNCKKPMEVDEEITPQSEVQV